MPRRFLQNLQRPDVNLRTYHKGGQWKHLSRRYCPFRPDPIQFEKTPGVRVEAMESCGETCVLFGMNSSAVAATERRGAPHCCELGNGQMWRVRGFNTSRSSIRVLPLNAAVAACV